MGCFHYRTEENQRISFHFIGPQGLDNTENTDSTSSCPSQEYEQRKDLGMFWDNSSRNIISWKSSMFRQTWLKAPMADVFTSRNITTTGREDMQNSTTQGPQEAHPSPHVPLISPVTCLDASPGAILHKSCCRALSLLKLPLYAGWGYTGKTRGKASKYTKQGRHWAAWIVRCLSSSERAHSWISGISSFTE